MAIPELEMERARRIVVPRRFKVKFRGEDSLMAARALETPGAETRVINTKRKLLSVQVSAHRSGLAAAERRFDAHLLAYERAFGGEVVEDYRYDLEKSPGPGELDDAATPGLEHVLKRIRAPEAWELGRGEGVNLAIIDTGIDGTCPEIPPDKRRGAWQPLGDSPWTDWDGHGTMCACIAAGVAPAAGLIACKTSFYDSELATIYDYLIERVEQEGSRIVAVNSFGVRQGTAPPDPQGSDFLPALDEAILQGIPVFFSAGNNHHLAQGEPEACRPTTIWLYKSRADLMTVSSCTLSGRMWYYASRGPGQMHGGPNMSRKPDVMAPTPENGRILYGDTVVSFPEGWGTSGACPQAAALAALILGRSPSLDLASLFETIRRTAVPVGHGWDCEGAGLIDCRAALESL
jgi:serine protease AprX